MREDNDPKHTAITPNDFIRRYNGRFLTGQVHHKASNQMSIISPPEEKNEGQNLIKQTKLKDAVLKVWEGITKEEEEAV